MTQLRSMIYRVGDGALTYGIAAILAVYYACGGRLDEY